MPAMDVYHFYAYSTAIWLSIQGLIIAMDPHFALSFISAQAEKASDNALNFTRAVSIPFFAIALITLLNPPAPIPSTMTASAIDPSTSTSDTLSSERGSSKPSINQPLPSQDMTASPKLREVILPLTTVLHALICAFSYTCWINPYAPGGPWVSWLYMVISGFFATMGGSTMMFGDESRPGRGSKWPFESTEARGARKAKWSARKEKFKKKI